MRQLRASLILFGFLCLTLPLMPAQLVFVLLKSGAARLLPWYYHRILCRLLGIGIKIEGPIPTTPALLVSNHVSWLDIPVLSSVLPLSFIAKREVGGWPMFGWMAKLQRCIFVNRESRHSTGKSLVEISKRLNSVDTLVLFPEGTSNDGNSVLPFKSSYFGVAENLEVPVVPVTLSYLSNYKLALTKRQRPSVAWYGDMDMVPHLWEFLKSGPIAVVVQFHQALPQISRKEMARRAQATIAKSLAETLHGRA
jgi:lyso-ornithine lipid O-acyltransferase